jgi:LuxR family maltose regulon positive regulatory protein
VNPEAKSLPIIRTKLYVPSMTLDHVPRRELLELMDKALEVPLTLVAAPAGFGKSVLVSDWARRQDQPVGWVSLDESDGELRQFLSYLVAAVDQVSPGACPDIGGLLSARELPSVATLASYLINGLDAIDGPCVVVLEDYHRLDRATRVHELIETVLEHPPPDTHFVIVTRRDPPLALTRLRAANRLVEVRVQDLQFTDAETSALLARTVGLTASEAALSHLQREMEGWAAGLRLVCLALRHTLEPEAFLTGLHGGIAQTQQYLMSEVLSLLSPGTRDDLMKTSILDRFCAELIEAVCRGDDRSAMPQLDGTAFLKLLRQHNLFILPLDAEEVWFRYHHLFQSLLQRQLAQQLTAADVARLHMRASVWFEAHGRITESIQQALAAGKANRAAEIVARHQYAMLEQDKCYLVKRWLDLLPADLQQRYPELLLAQAWVGYFTLHGAVIEANLERIESLLDGEAAEPTVRAEVRFLRGFLAFWAGDMQAAKRCCEQVLDAFPTDPGMIAGEVRSYLAMAMLMAGDGAEAASGFLEAERAAAAESAGDLFRTRLFAGEAYVHLLSGQLPAAIQAARGLATVAEASESTYAQPWKSYLQALPCLHAFALDDALPHFLSAKRRRASFERKAAVDTLAGLTLVYQLLQRPDDARRAAEELIAFSRELEAPEYGVVAESCRARLALLQGDLEAAIAWARSVTLRLDVPSLFIWLEEPLLTRARVQIAVGGEENLREARDMLDRLRPQLEALNNTCQTIEVSVLQALALAKQGRGDQALETVQQAVEIAAPGGWIRPFIELGQPMAELLAQLDVKADERDFVDRVLARFATGGAAEPDAVAPAQPARVRGGLAPDSLTNRELDILELLSQRLQNKEIAAKLFISTHTVNYHLKHIYQKLGVSSRRQAVTKAVDTGVLSAP